MPFWRTYYHLVWATANREALINSGVEPLLYAYMIKKSAELRVYVYAINGWFDHVHLIVSIPPKLSVADVVKNLKGSSSHDINKSGKLDCAFAWQRGYGVFTLGERQKADAEKYVCNQKIHHEQKTDNAWLECYSEFDEGPIETGIKLAGVATILHEEAAAYKFNEEMPF